MGELRGRALLELLIELSGVDRIEVERELTRLMSEMNLSVENLTMTDVQKLMLGYLEECHLGEPEDMDRLLHAQAKLPAEA